MKNVGSNVFNSQGTLCCEGGISFPTTDGRLGGDHRSCIAESPLKMTSNKTQELGVQHGNLFLWVNTGQLRVKDIV
jgi:hypothetical protein